MLDFYHKDYNIRYQDGLYNVLLDNDLILTYSDRYGEQIFGYRTPNRVVEAREALDYALLFNREDV